MVDPVTARLWGFRSLYLLLAAIIVFVRLLPLDMTVPVLPGPDLLLALTFCWTIRRPAYVPVLLVAAVYLATDLMFQRPPGLGAALVIAGTEFLRSRRSQNRDVPFAFEWGLVTVVLVGMVAANHAVLALFAVDRPSFGSAVFRGLVTAAIYPAVAFLSAHVLNVRKPSPGKTDALGHRL
ncbi:rod shape-determining protein MreD [Roseicyclus sp. F158]|uniref:Rod shape-determining protein MreD n=1 Tax=Tropicimonas omnivorans TaxID=3075590 RepID=A0ABU3DF76_9RHOB|nr:rod shape-determining protein MreD [Roseicyclus sp. F158]MDT0681777.1 rod shape-determining protein MreD [Roseicyclus sp. F158]